MSRSLFGDDVTSLKNMKYWYDTNREIFWCLKRIRRKRGVRYSEFVGFFILIPIKAAAEDLVRKEALNGQFMTTQHITSRANQPAALYVGAVAANGKYVSGIALSNLRRRIDEYHDSGVKRVYARPITPSGLTIAERYDFKAVNPSKEGELSAIYLMEMP